MDGPIYKDQLASNDAYQDELDYLVSRLRAALHALHERNDQSDAYLSYVAKWEEAFSAELTRCLLHLGIAKAAKRPLVVPDIMSVLVDRDTVFHAVDYVPKSKDDPSTIVQKYRNAWWHDREPSPLHIQELQKMWTRDAEFHFSQLKGTRKSRQIDSDNVELFSIADMRRLQDREVKSKVMVDAFLGDYFHDLLVLQDMISSFNLLMLEE